MLHILLFLITQIFFLHYNSTLKPMAPITTLPPSPINNITMVTTTTPISTLTTIQSQQSAPETRSVAANNILVFLNEQPTKSINNPQLTRLFTDITRSSCMAYLITSINTLRHFTIAKEQAYKKFNTLSLVDIKKTLSQIYHIDNSPYIIVLPQKESIPDDLLDLTDCTQLCSAALLNENNRTTFFKNLLDRIENIINNISGLAGNLKKESTVLKQLLKNQIDAQGSSLEDQKKWHFYFIGHGEQGNLIAGFSFVSGEIWNTLKLLNHISTGYLIITSCSSGGMNRKLLTGSSSPLKNANARFIDLYKKFEQNIISLNLTYSIILCSPTDATIITKSANAVSIIKKMTEEQLTEDQLITIFSNNDQSLSDTAQINKLPLIRRPHQNSFKPLLPLLKDKNSSLLINKTFQLTPVTQINTNLAKKLFFIDSQSVIQSNDAIIQKGLFIKPIVNKLPVAKTSNQASQITGYGHEQKLLELFPVASDTLRNNYTDEKGAVYEEYPQYPFFLSLQMGNAYHYLPTINTLQTNKNCSGEQGLFLCLRDLFFNANMRKSYKLYFIKSITGENDLPQQIIDKTIFKDNFCQSGEPITLENVAIATWYEKKLHKIECAFSYKDSYYSFFLEIEDKKNPQEWKFVTKLSQADFEKKLCKIEEPACSTIYDRLKSYPATHPQHDLIEQYLNCEKSIFLDFENSYPLFKDDHLPNDNNAWENLSELLKKHAQKQKKSRLNAQTELSKQESFARFLNKLGEYQKRPSLGEHQNSQLEEDHNSHS